MFPDRAGVVGLDVPLAYQLYVFYESIYVVGSEQRAFEVVRGTT